VRRSAPRAGATHARARHDRSRRRTSHEVIGPKRRARRREGFVITRLRRWRDRDHTRGNLLGSLLTLSLPLLATNLAGAIAYQIVDLALLSRLGDAAMAAVIIVNQTTWQVVLMMMMGATFATQALVASAIGAGDGPRAERTAAQSLLVGAAFAVVVALAGALFADDLFAATGAEPSFAEFGVPYLRLQLLLAFGLIGAMLFRAILIGAGDTTTGLFVTLAQTPIALVVEWALMFGKLGLPALGVRGAAIGVAVGQVFALGVGMWVLFSGGSRVRLDLGSLRPDRRLLARIVGLSWAPAVQMLGMVITTFVYLRLTRAFGGAVQAAYSIGLRVGMIVPLVSFPLASASATQVGQALGAGDVRRAWRAIGTGVLVHGGVLWTAAALLVLFRVEILGAVSGDPEVLRIGSEYLLFLGGSFAIMGVQLVVMRCLQGAGDFYVPMMISLGGALFVSLPLAVLSVRATDLGPTGLWAANLIAGAITAIATLCWLATGRWTARAARMHVGTAPRE
jgi:putative MATE family efflux protein